MKPSYGRSYAQFNNTQKLIDGLKALPGNYEFFDMKRFADDNIAAKHATPEHPCQSCMCIIGHGPSLGIPFIDLDRNDWLGYSIRAFGFKNDAYAWIFCFSANWHDSIGQAIARLEMAQRGEIPSSFNFTDIYKYGPGD